MARRPIPQPLPDTYLLSTYSWVDSKWTVLKSGKKRFRVRVRLNTGNQMRTGITFETSLQASLFINQFDQHLLNQKENVLKKRHQGSQIGKFDELYDQYVIGRGTDCKSVHPHNECNAIKKIINPYGITLLHEVTCEILERYQNSFVVIKKSGSKPDRSDCGFVPVQAIIRFLRHWEKRNYLIDFNVLSYEPVGKLKRPINPRDSWTSKELSDVYTFIFDFLKEEFTRQPCSCGIELPKFCEHESRYRYLIGLQKRMRTFLAIFRLISTTGTRPSEMEDAMVHNWSPETNTLKLYHTKTDEGRMFSIDQSTAALLNEATAGRQGDEPLFLTSRGNGWKSYGMQNMLNEIKEEMGRRGIAIRGTMYWARHTACTNMTKKNDAFTVMSVSGHSQVKTLQRYVHVHDDRTKKVAEAQLELDKESGIFDILKKNGVPTEDILKSSSKNVGSGSELIEVVKLLSMIAPSGGSQSPAFGELCEKLLSHFKDKENHND